MGQQRPTSQPPARIQRCQVARVHLHASVPVASRSQRGRIARTEPRYGFESSHPVANQSRVPVAT
eukprot:14490038-Alexandrium_andersonii.AAC.1